MPVTKKRAVGHTACTANANSMSNSNSNNNNNNTNPSNIINMNSNDTTKPPNDTLGVFSNYKEKYSSMKAKLKNILYENELIQDQIRKLQRELLDIYSDKEVLIERVILSGNVDLSDSDSESNPTMPSASRYNWNNGTAHCVSMQKSSLSSQSNQNEMQQDMNYNALQQHHQVQSEQLMQMTHVQQPQLQQQTQSIQSQQQLEPQQSQPAPTQAQPTQKASSSSNTTKTKQEKKPAQPRKTQPKKEPAANKPPKNPRRRLTKKQQQELQQQQQQQQQQQTPVQQTQPQQQTCLVTTTSAGGDFTIMSGQLGNYGQTQQQPQQSVFVAPNGNNFQQPTVTLSTHYSPSGIIQQTNMTAPNQQMSTQIRDPVYETVEQEKPYMSRLLVPLNTGNEPQIGAIGHQPHQIFHHPQGNTVEEHQQQQASPSQQQRTSPQLQRSPHIHQEASPLTQPSPHMQQSPHMQPSPHFQQQQQQSQPQQQQQQHRHVVHLPAQQQSQAQHMLHHHNHNQQHQQQPQPQAQNDSQLVNTDDLEQPALLMPDWESSVPSELFGTSSAIKFMAED